LWIASTVTAAIVMPKSKKDTKKEIKSGGHRKVDREGRRITWGRAHQEWWEQ
jgi:hypothetical protein